MLTPEEFVAAGDHLVATCPTWSWAKGDPNYTKAYLPEVNVKHYHLRRRSQKTNFLQEPDPYALSNRCRTNSFWLQRMSRATNDAVIWNITAKVKRLDAVSDLHASSVSGGTSFYDILRCSIFVADH